jgi:hypothetical protein
LEDEMSSVATEKPKPYTLGPAAGGRLPDIGSLFSATMGEFTDHLGDYLMLGLGQMLIVLPVVFALVFFIYFGISLLFVGGFVGSAILGAIVSDSAGDDAGALVASGGGLATAVLGMVAIFALILGVAALLAPVSASVARAVARHQRGEGKMTLQDAFSTVTQDLVPVAVMTTIMVTGTLFGLLFCYLPGIAFGMLLSMAPLLVYLHRQGAMPAFRRALSDVTANFGWYGQFAVIYFVVAMIASYIPLLGPMFMVSLHVRAYRERFGDAEEPVWDLI